MPITIKKTSVNPAVAFETLSLGDPFLFDNREDDEGDEEFHFYISFLLIVYLLYHMRVCLSRGFQK